MSEALAPAPVYAEGLAAGELRFQYCSGCDHAVFYPRVLCPYCGDPDLQWRTSAGLGTVYATTTLHMRGREPYDVSLVDLDEGFRMMSRVEGVAPEQVAIGSRVRATVIEEDGAPLAVFRPVDATEEVSA
ncbi:Zn-ribbon domain-containing OB-fold protein [Streptomyces sp. NPDC021080]|uniref:Zn-ribbon domain-containing OB-fold protein n=1 Tax=Streptomyces sp. NPDC021080 TaxID=3365110 RepID=UPI0037927546